MVALLEADPRQQNSSTMQTTPFGDSPLNQLMDFTFFFYLECLKKKLGI